MTSNYRGIDHVIGIVAEECRLGRLCCVCAFLPQDGWFIALDDCAIDGDGLDVALSRNIVHDIEHDFLKY